MRLLPRSFGAAAADAGILTQADDKNRHRGLTPFRAGASDPGRDAHWIREDELVLVLVYDEHGAWRGADDVFGDAAPEQARDAAASVRTDDDEVGVNLIRVVHDLVGGRW